MAKLGFNEQPPRFKYGNQPVKAIIDGAEVTFKSKLEYRYAQYLDWLKDEGDVIEWDYEGKLGRCLKPVFIFKNVKTNPVQYIPDFWVKFKDKHHIEWHECKGMLQQYDLSKFKRMFEQYPDQYIKVIFAQKPKVSVNKWAKLNRFVDEIITDFNKMAKKLAVIGRMDMV